MDNPPPAFLGSLGLDPMTATALERIRQVLGNPDPRTLAEAVLRWCIQRVEKGEIVAVEGALRPAPVVPPTRP